MNLYLLFVYGLMVVIPACVGYVLLNKVPYYVPESSVYTSLGYVRIMHANEGTPANFSVSGGGHPYYLKYEDGTYQIVNAPCMEAVAEYLYLL